jgi:hypothetical protein
METMAWSMPMGTTCFTPGTVSTAAFNRAKSSMGSSTDSPMVPP